MVTIGAPAPVAPLSIPPSAKAINIAIIVMVSKIKGEKLYSFKTNFPKCWLLLI